MKSMQLHQLIPAKLRILSYFPTFIFKKQTIVQSSITLEEEYKYDPEQYCLDKGIIQHPSFLRAGKHKNLRIKDR
ncbi:MAG: hypothetical protein H7Y00_08265 [Fimbriimonadaceae bacterium]|nr:hypothetical protein [Chitinophagales bacterium]